MLILLPSNFQSIRFDNNNLLVDSARHVITVKNKDLSNVSQYLIIYDSIASNNIDFINVSEAIK